jgi:hypothetical protein
MPKKVRKKGRIMYLKECMICNWKDVYINGNEDVIRASCLGCGHQGMFDVVKFVECLTD